uniref:Leucine-rich repeat family protein n=1 Tax=Brassica oleracea TaxID=3712 RepID=B2D2J4_BRAOL|nr:leucine-rich repeat family protein [Brassica oleracea]
MALNAIVQAGGLSSFLLVTMYFKESSPLNLSLRHPPEEVRSRNLSTEGYNEFKSFFDDVYRSLSGLRNLKIMDLSTNYFNYSTFPFLNAATSLTTLILTYNEMDGPFPIKLKDLTNLELLDLRANKLNGSMQFCKLKALRDLDLKGAHFVGQRPLCLGSLKKLRVLDLSSNRVSGDLPSSFSSLESLGDLSLSDNAFDGSFSLAPLTNLTNLKLFKLSSRSHTRQVKMESTWQPAFQLSVVVLRFCSLEKRPSFLLYQKSVRLVDLSSNALSGAIPTWLLTAAPELEVLQLQAASFTIFPRPTRVHALQIVAFSAAAIGKFPDKMDHALPALVRLAGSAAGFQGYSPTSIGERKAISFLDLSYANFSGKLPRMLVTGCVSPRFLKLSHNRLSGRFLPRETNFPSLDVLRRDNNLFTGNVGGGLSNSTMLRILDMLNAGLSGAVPRWLFEFPYLDYVLISNAFLEGTIPPSLLGHPFLSFLDLSGNRVSGALPSHVASELGIYMFLHNNNFTGPIPDTLLKSVQILDLRNAKLSGSIPQFDEYTEHKHSFVEGKRVNRDAMALAIPPSFLQTSLEMGAYSATFRVDKIEVDRSTYQETERRVAANGKGSIPQLLSSLTSLAVFDVSSNALSGRIPQGRQFNTFEEESYLGAPLRCGPPTSRVCETAKSPEEADAGQEEEDDKAAIDMMVFYFSTASRYVTALIGVLVLMCFDCPWRRAWLRIVDAFIASAVHVLP